ncbi:MAG TPA: alpha-amylase family glycosyl hydrolase [Bacteroidales bacterium]|nr:alpha-amylase family glycosyl hydrolase [Bacteroidales bacterium]
MTKQNIPSNSIPAWSRNLTIYEVNLRQYTPGGTFREFREHLPRLKKLGAGILWFMPLQPIGKLNRKGTMGSYYSISNYTAVDESYGTMDEFISLVKEIHEMGMYVILDWVANHTSWDHGWTVSHPDYYLLDGRGFFTPPFPEWEDVIKLDYNSQPLRKAMSEAMCFWLEITGIDGFRCDMAHLVPTSFWEQAKERLIAVKPDLFMLAESDLRELTSNAFHVLYNWNLFHCFNDVAQGKRNAGDLKAMFTDEIFRFPEHAANMLFISNHDENSWNGSELERLGLSLEAFAVLIFMLPGFPLLYSGQEAGNARRLSFFDKDLIEWKQDKMFGIYEKLTALRAEHPVFAGGALAGAFEVIPTTADAQVMAVKFSQGKHTVIAVINLGASHVVFHLGCEAQPGKFLELFSPPMPVVLGESPCFDLEAWQYKVLYSA